MNEDDCDRNKTAENYVDLLAREVDPASENGQHIRQQAKAAGIADSLDFIWSLAGKLKKQEKAPPLVMPENLKEMLAEEERNKSSKIIPFDDLEGLAAAGDGEKFDDL